MGGYTYILPRLITSMKAVGRGGYEDVKYAGRAPSATTATGFLKVHLNEQAELVQKAIQLMKREREVDSITMANYLMLLSRTTTNLNTSDNRVFECKTCNRRFTSFQALGGHCASHKKPRLMGESDGQVLIHGSPPKPKTHECSICGLEFAIGQALGGHMRRHRAAAAAASNRNMHTTINSLMSSGSSSGGSTVDNTLPPNMNHKVNDTKRILFPDLNLTPLENDLEFLKIGRQATPLVHCFN
ncbi:hypothetical protein JHK82_029537 [Glycine max]|nr:hypothetical protein JHK82_029537 [Glycine max]